MTYSYAGTTPAARLRPGMTICPMNRYDPATITKIEPMGHKVAIRTSDGRTTLYEGDRIVRHYEAE